MNQEAHNKLVSFIWSIADDCLRDVYVRGKYRDVILPMIVLRRIDALLEPTKEKVLEEVEFQREDGLIELDEKALCKESGYVFYNISKWTLQKLSETASSSNQKLEDNFLEYLDGFSQNVKEIIEKFNLKSQIIYMADKNILLDIIEKFTSTNINLTNEEKTAPDGTKLPPLTNLGMGYVFEELIRKFNEENNEEAGEHFTPREVINLMTHIIFEPIKDKIPPVISIYDPACGSGGMLTESEKFLKSKFNDLKINLYGKEINAETYAICISDMMIKGDNPKNIKNGSTLANDEFVGMKFDFILSNPPYGKSWSSEMKYIKNGNEVVDKRFIVTLKDYWGNELEVDAIPRSSDGQLLFLMEMIDKMKPLNKSPLGSRIASVHNGSSLFTGDAGSGESNIRRYIIENDMLEAIVQLPNNIFYNTGITTYIWILSNNKKEQRKGKVQLIDASKLYTKLRKNLGNKNCELEEKHIKKIIEVYQELKEVDEDIKSKVFENSDFGYYKVNIQRPKRLKAQLKDELIEPLKYDKSLERYMKIIYNLYNEDSNNLTISNYIKEKKKDILKSFEDKGIELTIKEKNKLLSEKLWIKHDKLYKIAKILQKEIGKEIFDDFNEFKKKIDEFIKKDKEIKISASEKNAILNSISWYDENAKKVIKKVHKLDEKKLNQLLKKCKCKKEDLADFGYYENKNGEYIEYESETELKDSENIPLKEDIHQYFLKEVKLYVNEAWIDIESVKIGYEISFNKYFYKHKPLRPLEEVTKDIIELEKESEGLIKEILGE